MKISNSKSFCREFMAGENEQKKYYESTSERNVNISGETVIKIKLDLY